MPAPHRAANRTPADDDAPGGRIRRDELMAWLDGHTNFELAMPTRVGAPTLERVVALCELLGDPQLAYPVIHLTGTNGKGSTARMVTDLLVARGLGVGTYTSPDLTRVNERITRDDVPIADDELAEVLGTLEELERLLPARPTRFELLTAAAFGWFADVAVDVAVVEVGLGGIWDATNVVASDVSVVTNVSYDHVDVLGPTLRDIASEKSGIVKAGSRVVVGTTDPELVEIFERAADDVGAAELWRREVEFGCEANRLAVGGRLLDLRTPSTSYEEVFLPLRGAHQGDNAACALAAVEAFFGTGLSLEVVEAGFSAVEVPGRLEVVGRDPLVVLDGAHNVAGAEALAQALVDEFPHQGERVAVVGMLQGRDPSAMIGALAGGGIRTVVACAAPSPRAVPPEVVAEAARAGGLTTLATDAVADAVTLGRARVASDGLLLVTGSLYVVAEARTHLRPDLDGHRRSR